MTTLREAAQQALEALDFVLDDEPYFVKAGLAITALRSALEEPEHDEPQPHKLSREVCGICWSQYDEGGKCGCKPPTDDVADSLALIVRNAIKYLKELEAQNAELDRKLADLEESNVMGAQSRLRTLTDEVIADLWYQNGTHHHHFARAIERWLKGDK